MRTPVLLALLLLLVTPVLAADEDPVLLATHQACFVHALPAWPAQADRVERVVGPGHALLHTSRATGKMTRLLPATGTVAINTRRISYCLTRVLGVAADAERLYVVLWASGRIFDRPPAEGAALAGGRYELRVFWLGDGGALPAPPLGPDGLPAAAPEPSLGRGPLNLVSDGVSCFGTTARYAGRALRAE